MSRPELDPAPSRPSLARRLLAWSLAGLVVLLLAGGAALSYAFRRSAEAAFDVRLEAWHRALIASLQIDAAGRLVADADLGDPRFEQVFSGWYWQVADASGKPLATSRSLWDGTLRGAAGSASAGAAGAIPLVGPREQPLRALVRSVTLPHSDASFEVTLAGDEAELRREIERFDVLLLAALGILGVGILALVAVQIRVALRPLRGIAAELAEVRAGTRERVGAGAPRELAPLVDSLNALLAHDADLVRGARTQAADLAHALKTPLSLVLAEAEELGDERGKRIARHAETMRRHIEFRLSTAAPRPAVARERTPLRPVVEAISETLSRLYPGVWIERQVDSAPVFGGAREDLEEIVGNLLENACKWAHGRVRVSGAMRGGRLALAFEDDGSGLDEAAYRAVLARGVRLDEQAPGSGLGLAIVRDLVALYGGELELSRSALGGLRVDVRLEGGGFSC
jgi:signal transduction histidine kinase